mgnify:CR=1 FL=1
MATLTSLATRVASILGELRVRSRFPTWRTSLIVFVVRPCSLRKKWHYCYDALSFCGYDVGGQRWG